MQENKSQPTKSSACNLVSIVIITRNAKYSLRKCLQSIYENIKNPFEIILIDNASNDSTVEMIQKMYPEVCLIKNQRNRGVAPARNQGLRLCRGDYILILDDDTEIINGAIDQMINFMNVNLNVGVCGPQLTEQNGTPLPSCKRFPSLLSIILNRCFDNPRTRAPLILERHLMLDWDHRKASPVDYIIGACQFIRKEALLEVGYYDDKIFYGPEDIDFCFRMWSKKWEVWYFPDARVVHETRRITKRNPLTLISLRHLLAIIRLFLKYRYKDFALISQNNDARRKKIT